MRHLIYVFLILSMILVCTFVIGCDDDDDDDSGGPVGGDDDDDDDMSDDDDDDDISDDDDDDDDDNDDDTIPTFGTFAPDPQTDLLPQGVESCAVYKETECFSGTIHSCEMYDSNAGDWEDDPDPMVEQMFWYDRYYDLYHEMEGQHTDMEFTQPMPAGTPESTWGDPQYFQEYKGYGDGSGWTGTALQASAARYLMTGTDADYERMLEKMETMVLCYTMNEIPGLLMRSFFAMLEDGAPRPIGNPGKALAPYHEPGNWHFRYPISDDFLNDLPAYFTDGADILGTHYNVTPVWMGDASRDMYVRSLPGLLLAYDNLKDGPQENELKQAVERELPCTLNRLKKLRISNLQSNQIIIQALEAYLGTNRLILEQDDIDFTTLDTLVGYVMEQPNPNFMDAFDAECPDGPPMEVDPEYDLDASDFFGFMLKIINIGIRSSRAGAVPIAWIQFPSVRGSDTIFMTQWALTAHYLTGDDQYLDFVELLMEETEYWAMIDTFGSFYSPKWCRPHFAPSLLYPSLWHMQNRVDRDKYPDYWNQLGFYIAEEFRYKELVDAKEVYFGILYDTMVDSTIDPDVADHVTEMVDMLKETSQRYVADKNEPRRNYPVDLINDPPAGLVTEDLSQEEYDMCTEPIIILGIEIPGGSLEDELPRAVEGMPIAWRVPGSFQWAMDPFMLQRTYGSSAAKKQWPMQGFSVSYWTGRMQGTILEGDGNALGWKDTGQACK